MHEHNHNTIGMARAISSLPPHLITIWGQLIHLLAQPASDHNTVMIWHFWFTLRDRLTDREYIQFKQVFNEMLEGGQS